MRARCLAFFHSGSAAISGLAPVASPRVEFPPSTPPPRSQQVGLTEIAVEYDCPAVQGRKIWGGAGTLLVSFG